MNCASRNKLNTIYTINLKKLLHLCEKENKLTSEYTRSFMLLARFVSLWILHGKATTPDQLKHLFWSADGSSAEQPNRDWGAGLYVETVTEK